MQSNQRTTTNGRLLDATRSLTTVSRPLERVAPETVLSLARRAPHGFWGRGESWSAWLEVAAALEVLGPQNAGSLDVSPCPGASAPADYVERIRAAADCVLRGVEDAASIRFYGGFAFRGDHLPRGLWVDHPAGSFVLPRLEVRSGPDGAQLRCTVLSDEGREAAEAEAVLTLEQAAARIDEARRVPVQPPGTEGARVQEPAGAARSHWEAAVRHGLREIAEGRLAKVVLARTLDVETASPVDPVAVLARLRAENPEAHVFLFSPQGDSAFLGAAPEIVAQVDGPRFRATAVAGSIGRGRDAADDARLAAALDASRKDRAEHAVVLSDMLDRLRGRVAELSADEEPSILRLARIQHLESVITGRLDGDAHVLPLLAALHPTPAVCGYPRDEALRLLREEEPFERGWYSGPVGWFDGGGDGTFAPGLRSAVVRGRTWRLYAGAGIVEGSEPEAEWEETRMKLQPMLRGLGLDA